MPQHPVIAVLTKEARLHNAMHDWHQQYPQLQCPDSELLHTSSKCQHCWALLATNSKCSLLVVSQAPDTSPATCCYHSKFGIAAFWGADLNRHDLQSTRHSGSMYHALTYILPVRRGHINNVAAACRDYETPSFSVALCW